MLLFDFSEDLSFPRRRESSVKPTIWIPAYAGMTTRRAFQIIVTLDFKNIDKALQVRHVNCLVVYLSCLLQTYQNEAVPIFLSDKISR